MRPPARKRRTPERLGQLAACALKDPAESLATLLARVPYFVDFSAFARDRALADGESEQLARELALVQIATPVGVIVVSELTSKRLDENLLVALAAFHANSPDLPGRGMALGVGEVKFTGMVRPTVKLVTYGIDFKRVMKGKLVLGIADGWMAADGKRIYEAKDLRVCLAKE